MDGSGRGRGPEFKLLFVTTWSSKFVVTVSFNHASFQFSVKFFLIVSR